MNIKKGLNIAILEDDILTSNCIIEILESDGFNGIVHFKTYKEAETYLYNNKPDLLILDINLPDGNGLDLLKSIRKRQDMIDMPVIILTAHNDIENKRIAFKNYADIFLSKPVDYEEILLWLNSLLKRKEVYENSYFSRDVIQDKRISIDCKLRVLKYKGKEINNLTNREFDLLYTLIKNSPRIFSRQEIIRDIWKTYSVENLVDIHLHNLRRKLPPELSKMVVSVKGIGFRFLF